MKVTKLLKSSRRADSYAVYIDNKFSFSLSGDGLLKSKLVVGQELTSQELVRLKKLSSRDRLLALAYTYIALRPRSRWEVEKYLEAKDATPALLLSIVNKLIELNLINDLDFARRWIQNRQLLRPGSVHKLKYELKAKHIDQPNIDQAIAELEDDSEISAIRAIIAKKQRISRYQDPQKMQAYLARQGFRYGDIKKAMEPDDNQA